MNIKKIGGSHDKELQLEIYNFPSNVFVDYNLIEKDLQKRRPSKKYDTPRVEKDDYKIINGVKDGYTTGETIKIVVYNKKVESNNYKRIQTIFRPSHADFVWYYKYNEFIPSGGGPLSARLTVLDVIAGAFAKMAILKEYPNVSFNTFVYSVGNEVNTSKDKLNELSENIIKLLEKIREEGDSIGGKVKCIVKNLPIGLGDPNNKLDSSIAYNIVSIPAVKAIEIGSGVEASKMLGSKHNDPYTFDSKTNKIKPLKNDAGGVLGGISTGEDLVITATFKPIPSIAKAQKTVDVNGKDVELIIGGKHDVCAAIRGAVVVEAKVALVIANFLSKKIKKNN